MISNSMLQVTCYLSILNGVQSHTRQQSRDCTLHRLPMTVETIPKQYHVTKLQWLVLIFVLLCNTPVLLAAQTPASQVEAITDVYTALGVPASEMQGDPCGGWTGVECNTRGITEMYLIR